MASAGGGGQISSVSGSAKLKEVTDLIEMLGLDLREQGLSESSRNAALEQLKIHGRVVQDADPIFTKNGIDVLTGYAFRGDPSTTSREALRCLANALVLVPATRQIFVDGGHAIRTAEGLQSEDDDDEFLLSRILFLLTYGTDLDFEILLKNHGLADNINRNILRFSAKYGGSKNETDTDPRAVMAISETLKLLFNVTHFFPASSILFTESVPHILKILSTRKLPDPPLQPPVTFLINSLISLKLGTAVESPLFPLSDETRYIECLVRILEISMEAYPEEELDQLATPLVTLMRRILDLAPESVRQFMQRSLLPQEEERQRPLGKSNSLSSRLLQSSTSAMLPTLREHIQSFLFELSGKDASTFVHNVGYGFASGFLMSHNIPLPRAGNGATTTNDDDNESVNPITGQRISAEAPVEMPEMTEDEKEREAERLFVLFERLKKTGVVDVKNPVEDAVQNGRFEELD